MAKYVFVFRYGAVAVDPPLSPTDMERHLRKWYAWRDELAKAGHEPSGQPLESRGKIVRGRERIVTDGPFTESKDLVTGTMLISCASLDEAVALAHGCPIYEFDGAVEVRPVLGGEPPKPLQER